MIHSKAVRHSRTVLVAVTAVVLFATAACSSSGSKTTSSPPSSPPASASGESTSGDYTATAQAAVDAAYKGLYTKPTAGGPKAQKGKNIWVVPCSSALFGCSQPAASIQQAAKVLDWKVTIADGKASPAGYSAAINQAVAAHADGIITIAIDCPAAKSALQKAKNAKIPTVGVFDYDCNDPKAGGGPSLYSATINSNGTPAQFGAQWGKLKADYAIAATKGKAQAVVITHSDFIVTQYEDAAYKAEFAKCSGCKILKIVDITGQQLGNPTQTGQTVATALQQYPNANVLDAPDDTTTAEITQAVTAAHRSNLVVVAGEGYPTTLAAIKKGVVTAAAGVPGGWLGWEGADAMNRVLAGQPKIPNQGASFQMIDKTHGLPASTSEPFTPTIDYTAAFTANWTATG